MLSKKSIEVLNSLPVILSISDMAAVFKCSTVTIRRLIRKGHLKAFRTKEGWMIYRGDLIDYLSEQSNL